MSKITSLALTQLSPALHTTGSKVSMTTYPRVHMFSLDLSVMSGSLKSGSLGLALKDFPIQISAQINNQAIDIVPANLAKDLLPLLDKIRHKLNNEAHWLIEVDMPPIVGRHTGLGTTTQITGAVALCVAATVDKEFTHLDLFNLGIGYESALGLNLLFSPGFILENGYKISDKESGGCNIYPHLNNEFQVPVGSILHFSDMSWRLLLAIPKNAQSLSGKIENDFWNQILPDKVESTHNITYAVLEKIIPSIVTNDYNEFISGMRAATSNGTKPMEESIQNVKTKSVLATLRKDYGFAAISSLGPTVYSFTQDTLSESALTSLNAQHADFAFYSINSGAQ